MEEILTPQLLSKYEKLCSQVGDIEELILRQIDDVFQTIFSVFELGEYYGYNEQRTQFLLNLASEEYELDERRLLNAFHSYCTKDGYVDFSRNQISSKSRKQPFVMLNETRVLLFEKIPLEWFFITDLDDLALEIEKAKKAYEQHLEVKRSERKAKTNQTKQAKEDLVKQIKAKLTPEELAYFERTKAGRSRKKQ